MLPTLRRKLEALAERRDELERLLSDPATVADQGRFRALSREFAQLEPVATALAEERRTRDDLDAARAMLDDADMRELAQEEIAAADARLEVLPDATHWLHLEEPEWVVELILDHLQRDG